MSELPNDDGAKWGPGPQTEAARQKVSDVTRKTETGVWGAKRRYETKQPYTGLAGVNYSELIERLGIEELLEQEGILSEVLQVFVRRAIIERLFFTETMLAQQSGNTDKRDTYAKYHQLYSKGAISDGLKLMNVLEKINEGVIDLALSEAINENSQAD